MTETLRNIQPLRLPDIDPALIGTEPPRFESMCPSDLLVDEHYQRSLSERSVRLIRKIVAEWDWRRFKPPVVAEVDGTFHLIDGQHTAIAAASHPHITNIPVMVVQAAEMADRARAFIGQNRDRIGVTGMQLHQAALAAADEDAQTIEQVCQRAGVTLLRMPPANGIFQPGETLAIATIRKLINLRGVVRARQTLEVLRDAKAAPISADLIKATSELLFAETYAGEISAEALTLLIRGLGAAAEKEAATVAMAKGLPRWRALVIVLFTKRRR